MKEEFLKIINHFGIDAQQRKLQEEVFELQEIITQYNLLNYQNTLAERREEQPMWKMEAYKEFIEEEMADVYVMLSQIFYYYDLDSKKIGEIMGQKVKRTLKKIEKEEEK